MRNKLRLKIHALLDKIGQAMFEKVIANALEIEKELARRK